MLAAGLAGEDRRSSVGLTVKPYRQDQPCPRFACGRQTTCDNAELTPRPGGAAASILLVLVVQHALLRGRRYCSPMVPHRRIERLPRAGGAKLFAPDRRWQTGHGAAGRDDDQGMRECISLTLQDGRTLVCTPDHMMLCADGRWVRADELGVEPGPRRSWPGSAAGRAR